MKGTEAEYVISLKSAFNFPPKKRPRKAVNTIKTFVWKHARTKDVAIATEVNEFIGRKSLHIPRKLNAVLVKEKEKVKVYLKDGQQLKTDKSKKAEAEKKKKEEEKAKEAAKKKEEKTAEASEEEKEQETKKAEKKEREKAAEKADIKRKIKK